MTTIQLEISDELIALFGIKAIQARLQKQLEIDRLSLLGEKIQSEIELADLNHHSLFEEARSQAWEKLKHIYLKDVEE